MSFEFFLSKRFLKPKKESKFVSFITLISIAGVTIGVTALIISVSILNGFEKEITEKAVSVSSHIQVTSFKPEGIKDYPGVIEELKNPKHELPVVSAHPYVQREAVIKYKDKTEGIILKGVRNEDNIFGEQRVITAGSSELKQIDSSVSTIIIGNKIAQKLGIELGSKIFIIATTGIPSPTNTPDIKQFRVSGFYQTGLREYDDVMLYCSMQDAQKLFEMKNNVTGIELMISKADKIASTTNDIRKILEYPLYAKSVFQIYKGLFTWVELQKKPIPIVLGLIVIVAAFNIIAFLLMIVLEKTETIGILKSLGAANRDIIKIFFYQGMFISIIGIVLGNILGYGICLLQLKYDIVKIPDIYNLSHVPLLIDSNVGILITGITLILSICVTIIPSYLASKLNPVTSLRFK
ncbi:MAG: ABC transporter permease [Ignavibacteriae bacterium]|nr:MAG: ABC transporter permease [Ignavibacteriota bacterium]